MKLELLPRCPYHRQNEWVSKIKTGPFIYPVITNIGKNNTITKLYWTCDNNRGHYGIPKVVFGRFGYGLFIDRKGEYSLTEDCVGIVAEPKNLDNIARAMKTEKFIKLMSYTNTGGLGECYNRRIIKQLRHDFWRDFIETN